MWSCKSIKLTIFSLGKFRGVFFKSHSSSFSLLAKTPRPSVTPFAGSCYASGGMGKDPGVVGSEYPSVSSDSYTGACFIKSDKHIPTIAYIRIHTHIFSNLSISKMTQLMHPVWLSRPESTRCSFLSWLLWDIIFRSTWVLSELIFEAFLYQLAVAFPTEMCWVYLDALFFALRAHVEPRTGSLHGLAVVWCWAALQWFISHEGYNSE